MFRKENLNKINITKKVFILITVVSIVVIIFAKKLKPYTWKGVEIEPVLIQKTNSNLKIGHEIILSISNDPFRICKSDSIQIYFSDYCVYSGSFFKGSNSINIINDNYLLDIVVFDGKSRYSFCPKEAVRINNITKEVELTFEFWNNYDEIISIQSKK